MWYIQIYMLAVMCTCVCVRVCVCACAQVCTCLCEWICGMHVGPCLNTLQQHKTFSIACGKDAIGEDAVDLEEEGQPFGLPMSLECILCSAASPAATEAPVGAPLPPEDVVEWCVGWGCWLLLAPGLFSCCLTAGSDDLAAAETTLGLTMTAFCCCCRSTRSAAAIPAETEATVGSDLVPAVDRSWDEDDWGRPLLSELRLWPSPAKPNFTSRKTFLNNFFMGCFFRKRDTELYNKCENAYALNTYSYKLIVRYRWIYWLRPYNTI